MKFKKVGTKVNCIVIGIFVGTIAATLLICFLFFNSLVTDMLTSECVTATNTLALELDDMKAEIEYEAQVLSKDESEGGAFRGGKHCRSGKRQYIYHYGPE